MACTALEQYQPRKAYSYGAMVQPRRFETFGRAARMEDGALMDGDGIVRAKDHMHIYTTKRQTIAPRDETRPEWAGRSATRSSSDTSTSIADTHVHLCMPAGR